MAQKNRSSPRLYVAAKRVNSHWTFQLLTVVSIIFALFGGGLWELLDLPDTPWNPVLDALMILFTVLFAVEIVLNLYIDRQAYLGSFFFVADFVGTISMIFEVSFILGTHGKMIDPSSEHTLVLLRTARTAKVGFRAGRLVKFVKCLPLISAMGLAKLATKDGKKDTSVFFTRLMFMLTTRVACMTVILAVVPPFFTLWNYPQQELPKGILEDDVESYSWNMLAHTPYEMKKVVKFLIFGSDSGGQSARNSVETKVFARFLEHMEAGYLEKPYHNFAHACDVMHTIHRFLADTSAHLWLTCEEVFALKVAALGHDLGHFGKTNAFLIETRHDLALRYNDRSPLENMHCSKLYDILRREETNVFKSFGDQKTSRKVCVESILHTDMAEHFNMVKELETFYELACSACDAQARDVTSMREQYLEEVLLKSPYKWLQVFLHLADVSNPLKPFNVCQAWAWRVLEEFFQQGDDEKRLGMPVGMLNDRDRVNKPGSQHGFINFLVAPFAFSTIQVFPMLCPLSTQMAANLQQWRDLWVLEAKPSVDETAKKDADVAKVRERADTLAARRSRRTF